MTKFARIINGTAIDVCLNPKDNFHPLIAAEFVTVPENVEVGHSLINGVWTAAIKEDIFVVDSNIYSIKIAPIDFKLLLTPTERVAVNQVKATDALVNDFFSLVEDPRMTTVDLGLQSTKDIINHLVTINILTPQRAEDILANKPV